jgi:hypothetical protein
VSETTANTIGIVLVSRCSAAVTGVVLERITSGLSAGGVENEADLVGERRATAGAVGGELGLV